MASMLQQRNTKTCQISPKFSLCNFISGIPQDSHRSTGFPAGSLTSAHISPASSPAFLPQTKGLLQTNGKQFQFLLTLWLTEHKADQTQMPEINSPASLALRPESTGWRPEQWRRCCWHQCPSSKSESSLPFRTGPKTPGLWGEEAGFFLSRDSVEMVVTTAVFLPLRKSFWRSFSLRRKQMELDLHICAACWLSYCCDWPWIRWRNTALDEGGMITQRFFSDLWT